MRLSRLALCLTITGCGSAQDSAQNVAGYLRQLRDRGEITGSVLVNRGGSTLVNEGFGFAEEDLRSPNTPGTRFRVGSVTKQFTAMAVLILQERGMVQVSHSVCDYIPNCPAHWQPINLHHLLTHSSGIPDYTNFDDFASLIDTPVTVEQLIDRFRSIELEFSPGSRWKYSNSGYILLGDIIERTSGQSYAEFLNQNIFQPLGMQSTGYDSNDPPVPAHAQGYLRPGVKPVHFDMSEVYAAGALYSTTEDLYLWDEALLAGRLISGELLRQMIAPQIPCPGGGCALPTDVGYGYGWFIAREAAQNYIYHWGHIDGFLSSNGFYPDAHLIVVVLSNLETTDVFGISTQLGKLAAPSP